MSKNELYFYPKKKKFARMLERFASSHLKRKSISVHLRTSPGNVVITADS